MPRSSPEPVPVPGSVPTPAELTRWGAAEAVAAPPRRLSFASLVPGMPKEATSQLAGVVVVSFGISIGIGIIFPLLPGFGRDLGLSLGAIGLLVSAFGVSRLVVDAAGGWIFRLASERAVATAGAAIVAVGSFLTAIAGAFAGLLLARILHGIGVALFVNAGAVYLGREAPAAYRARSLGLHQGAMLLGTTLGPVVGGVLASIGGIRLPFVVAGSIGVMAIPWSFRQFPARVGHDLASRGSTVRVDRALRWTLVVAFASYLIVWGTRSSVRFTLVPLYVEESLGESVLWTSLILTILSIGDVAGFVFGGQVADRLGRRRVLTWGFFGSAAIVALWAATTAAGQLVPIAIAFGVVGGLVGGVPAAVAADIAGGRASTMTTLRLGGDAGIMIGPLIATASAEAAGYDAAFLFHGAMFAVAGALALTTRETRHQRGDGTFDPGLT